MAEVADNGVEDALRDIRDRLLTELALLDSVGEFVAAVEIDAAIRILNERLDAGYESRSASSVG